MVSGQQCFPPSSKLLTLDAHTLICPIYFTTHQKLGHDQLMDLESIVWESLA